MTFTRGILPLVLILILFINFSGIEGKKRKFGNKAKIPTRLREGKKSENSEISDDDPDGTQRRNKRRRNKGNKNSSNNGVDRETGKSLDNDEIPDGNDDGNTADTGIYKNPRDKLKKSNKKARRNKGNKNSSNNGVDRETGIALDNDEVPGGNDDGNTADTGIYNNPRDKLKKSNKKARRRRKKQKRGRITTTGLPTTTNRSPLIGGGDTGKQDAPRSLSKYVVWLSTDLFSDIPKCTGTLISSHRVVTATHCVKDIDDGILRINLGDYDLTVDEACEQTLFVSSREVSPNNPEVTVFTLEEPVAGPCYQPVDVAYSLPPSQAELMVVGWGKVPTQTGVFHDVLQHGHMQFWDLSPANCPASNKYNMDLSNTICVKTNSEWPCHPDRGGPLFYNGLLVALVHQDDTGCGYQLWHHMIPVAGTGTWLVGNSCDQSPCANGGTCTNNGKTFTCTCKDGFSGPHCTVDHCPPARCCPGECFREPGGGHCHCPIGFVGQNCEINLCDNSHCGPGKCIPEEGSHTCVCPHGLTGSHCDIVEDDPCKGPATPGDCGDSAPSHNRWFFNHETWKCEQFTWRGCDQRKNNYLTKNMCQITCRKDQHPCYGPKQVGSCSETYLRWYFDPADLSCKMFYWSGCEKGSNNYAEEIICFSACLENQGYCYGDPDTAVCDSPKDRYFYDPIIQECVWFKWYGCGSNLNNYPNLHSCQNTCMSTK